jgi:alanyl-tRNA synthetase
MFEMLGLQILWWWPKEAIQQAWEFFDRSLKLDKIDLYVSVL